MFAQQIVLPIALVAALGAAAWAHAAAPAEWVTSPADVGDSTPRHEPVALLDGYLPSSEGAAPARESAGGESTWQPRTLVGGRVDHGGYGGLVLKPSVVRDQFGLFVGGQGGWIINHVFVIGGGGYGLSTNVRADDRVGEEGRSYYVEVGYGGLILEYFHRPEALVHVSGSLLVGAGGATYTRRHRHERDDPMMESSPFFVTEGSLLVNLNVTPFLRLSAGPSFRLAQGLDLEHLSNADLTSFGGSFLMRFGRF